MKRLTPARKGALLVLATFCGCSLLFAFSNDTPGWRPYIPSRGAQLQDTVPSRNKSQRDAKTDQSDATPGVDLDEIERGLQNIDRALGGLHFEFDHLEHLQADLHQLRNNLELKKLEFDLHENLDLLKHNLDLEKLNLDLQMENLQHRLPDLQLNFELQAENMKRAKELMELELPRLEQVKTTQFELYNNLVDDLKKDGLIKSKGYSLRIEKGNLYINGQLQPASVTDKYRNQEKYGKLFDKQNTIQFENNDDDIKSDDI